MEDTTNLCVYGTTMARPNYRRSRLPIGRRLITDSLYFARAQYAAGCERLMKLADVVAARQQAWPRPSWGAIMTRAFALAARDHPEMRRVYFEFPFGHIGEFDAQTACVAVLRNLGDEEMVFLAPLQSPENQTLVELDNNLRRYQQEPIESFNAFRQALMLAKMPGPIRRIALWLALHVLPRRRVRHFGTFIVTTMGPFGARTLSLPTLSTPVLHYGAFSESGEVPVGLVIDHRIMDGAVVGYTLLEMEQVLHRDIRAELLALANTARAA